MIERVNVSSMIQSVSSIPNCHPWTDSNIDEGPLATATMESAGEDLFRSKPYHIEND